MRKDVVVLCMVFIAGLLLGVLLTGGVMGTVMWGKAAAYREELMRAEMEARMQAERAMESERQARQAAEQAVQELKAKEDALKNAEKAAKEQNP